MKNELAMRLFSRKPLTTDAAIAQISALSDLNDGELRPDKCGEFEPLRKIFDRNDISEPVAWLSKPHGSFIYRRGKPAYSSGVIWNLSHPANAKFPSPAFVNYWTAEFDGQWAEQHGIEKLQAFVSHLFSVVRADFGLFTTQLDLDAKNRQEGWFSYTGLNPALGVPGLYWINFFSREYASWLGLDQLPKTVGVIRSLNDGAHCLSFCESHKECRSLDVFQRQKVAIEWLGIQRFFDIRYPERKLEVPDWGSPQAI